MNNMKPAYVKLLNKKIHTSQINAIGLLIQEGGLINMRASMINHKTEPELMEVDAINVAEVNIGLSLVSVD